MNRRLLLSLQRRNNARLTELRGQLERNEVRAEDLEAVQQEVQTLADEAQEIADALANLGEDPEDPPADPPADPEEDPENRDDDPADPEDPPADPENRSGITEAQRSAVLNVIGQGLSTRGHRSTQTRSREIRSAFANFVVGNITESEARSLGVEINNGSVTVPVEISREIITYAQEENLLRRYGSYVNTDADVKYPVLVRKAEAQGHKSERTTNEIPETDIEFDSIDLDPTEFDALATITKKLLKRTGVKIEQIVIDELKKAYVRKETKYMFKGDEAGNENPGSLEKKAVAYYEAEAVGTDDQKLYKQLVLLKNQPVTEVLKKSMWIINRAALTRLEGMLDLNGRPLLYEAPNGVGYKLLGHTVDFTDAADGSDPTKPVFYFGDFKAFHIQEIKGGMELQKLVEKFAGTNKVGFQIYNLIDGQLIYSPFEPAMYRYEVGATAPVTP
ncbi:phage major capsid protein [Metabacillus halosaccharovorans]|uniref:Phage major capsid protein n=1 Tax=Metabacillus halosaccharovorans TaxID=930124 RepID=A0ABT3DCC0_9BACI|nr:phage major capsid protein [Metabacillus halosaccharovorans]MCV9884705.1 phage major capsid protein [Metabacillus halosaccharovorans]